MGCSGVLTAGGCPWRGDGASSCSRVPAAGCPELAPAPRRELRCRHSRRRGARRGSWWSWRAGPKTPTAWLRTPRWVWGGCAPQAMPEPGRGWMRDAAEVPGWALEPSLPPQPMLSPSTGKPGSGAENCTVHVMGTSPQGKPPPPPPPPQALPASPGWGVAHDPPPHGQAGGVRRSGCPCTPWATSS